MSISRSEERLFKNWEESRVGFVRDGVVSERHYLSASTKIAFILKEVNDLDGGGWDLREFVFDGGRPQTWDNVSRWVHAIWNLPEIENWDFYEQISPEFRRETLKNICVMNLKKSPGTHTTNYKSLRSVAREDSQFIKNQFALYEPEITICGGTAELFKEIVDHSNIEWQITSRGVWWYESDLGKYVISFSHPETRVQSSLLLYGLVDAISEIYA